MVRRPTIPDLAQAAGVSVSTVNRVINDAAAVRRAGELMAKNDYGQYLLQLLED